jgi:hypothetical protein
LKSAAFVPIFFGVIAVTFGLEAEFRLDSAGRNAEPALHVACASTLARGANIGTDTTAPRASGSGSSCNPA